MNFKDFDKFADEFIKDVLHMRDTKGKEYAQDESDRFGNFNRLAERTKMPRERVWQVYFTKHLDSIESYIEHGRSFSDENIRGRLVDAVTYLILLAGMLTETKMGSGYLPTHIKLDEEVATQIAQSAIDKLVAQREQLYKAVLAENPDLAFHLKHGLGCYYCQFGDTVLAAMEYPGQTTSMCGGCRARDWKGEPENGH